MTQRQIWLNLAGFLTLIGPSAATVLPALTHALEDRTPLVRYTATRHFAFTLTPPIDRWPVLSRLLFVIGAMNAAPLGSLPSSSSSISAGRTGASRR